MNSNITKITELTINVIKYRSWVVTNNILPKRIEKISIEKPFVKPTKIIPIANPAERNIAIAASPLIFDEDRIFIIPIAESIDAIKATSIG